MTSNVLRAMQSMKMADKKTQTTFTRWKPNWDRAAQYYRDSEKYFRLCGDHYDEYLFMVLQKSGVAHEGCNSFHTAGEKYLAAAKLAQKLSKGVATVVDLLNNSFRNYLLNNSTEQAVKQLAFAADVLEQSGDVDEGLSYMTRACNLYADGTCVFELHEAVFNKTISYCFRNSKYEAAMTIMKQQNAVILERASSTFDIEVYKNILAALIIQFYLENHEIGTREFMESSNVLNFKTSDAYIAGNHLIKAHESGTDIRLEVFSAFRFLPRHVFRLINQKR